MRTKKVTETATNRTPIIRDASKADPRTQLKSTWAAGAEDLCEARARLTEFGRVSDVAAVLNQVGGVEKIEDFAEQDQAHPLAA